MIIIFNNLIRYYIILFLNLDIMNINLIYKFFIYLKVRILNNYFEIKHLINYYLFIF